MPRELVTSASNPVVRTIRALKQRGAAGGPCLLEGVKLIEEARAAGVPLEMVAAGPRLRRSPRGRALASALEAEGTPVRWLDDDLLASLSEVETTQGVLALAKRPDFAEERLFEGTPLILVVAGVQNPGNVGALLRASEAAGATGAYLTDGSADPLSWKALRGSMGSALRLPHRSTSSAEALARLRARGVPTLAAVSAGGPVYHEVDLRRPVAFVLGAEGAGLPPELVQAAEGRVRIPMRSPVESLNVAVAAGVLLYEAARQRRG